MKQAMKNRKFWALLDLKQRLFLLPPGGSTDNHVCLRPDIELYLVEPEIIALFVEKFLVRAHFADLSFVKYNDLICFTDGGKPVRNYNRSTTKNEGIDGFL